MEINFVLNEEEFSDSERKLVIDCLNISDDEFENSMQKLSKTAFMEYLKMFKEKGVPSRADEVLQERLFFLLKNYYINRLPSENEISAIFQLTNSQSITLLRNTISRYRTRINIFIKNSLINIIKKATQIEEKETVYYQFVITSKIILEELNMIVSQKGPALRQIRKIPNISSKYECERDTYNLLRIELGIED